MHEFRRLRKQVIRANLPNGVSLQTMFLALHVILLRLHAEMIGVSRVEALPCHLAF